MDEELLTRFTFYLLKKKNTSYLKSLMQSDRLRNYKLIDKKKITVKVLVFLFELTENIFLFKCFLLKKIIAPLAVSS